jgi:hypothetical protein
MLQFPPVECGTSGAPGAACSTLLEPDALKSVTSGRRARQSTPRQDRNRCPQAVIGIRRTATFPFSGQIVRIGAASKGVRIVRVEGDDRFGWAWPRVELFVPILDAGLAILTLPGHRVFNSKIRGLRLAELRFARRFPKFPCETSPGLLECFARRALASRRRLDAPIAPVSTALRRRVFLSD